MQNNTVVSGAKKLLHAIDDFKGSGEAGADSSVREGFGILLRVLYPAAPHIAHELWHALGYVQRQGDLLDAPWPNVDEQALKQDEIELVLQINGKHRGSVLVPAAASRREIEKLAVASEAFAAHAAGATPKKVIVVPGRLVNVVI
jgi:leucyl-tRNA synthetase